MLYILYNLKTVFLTNRVNDNNGLFCQYFLKPVFLVEKIDLIIFIHVYIMFTTTKLFSYIG